MAPDPAVTSGRGNGKQTLRVSWVDRTPREITLEVLHHLDRSDLKSFIRTCRGVAHNFRDELIRHDISTKTYDSLATACYFDDAALALKCLKLGASPNVVFIHGAGRGEQSPLLYLSDTDISLHSQFQSPVFPTITAKEGHVQDGRPCCALTVATKLNHVQVMKILLGFWPDGQGEPVETADVVERRMPTRPKPRMEFLEHPVVLAHVCSSQAALLLLTAGAAQGDTHINDSGENAYCLPLRAILSHYHVNLSEYYNPRRPPFGTLESLYPRLEGHSQHYIPEDELRAIVELLLDNGAHPRQPLDRPDPQGIESSLVAAITTGYRSVTKAMAKGGPWIMDQEQRECDIAFRLVLNDRTGDFPWGVPLQHLHQDGSFLNIEQFLADFLEAGASPVDHLLDGRRPLTVVQQTPTQQTPALVRCLLESGADPNITDSLNLCSLARSLIPTVDEQDTETESLIPLLLSFGANVNQPSLHIKGFSPLMFATGDAVDPTVFKTLLRAGAEREYIGELSPGGLRLTVLQCLLAGFPKPSYHYQADMQAFTQHDLETLIRVSDHNNSNEIILDNPHTHEDRERRFASFITPWADILHFYTPDMRHVINWAIDNLFGFDLTGAIKLLAPHYRTTRLSTDKETPLSVFFSQHRMDGYLKFGTLDETYKAVKAMFACDFGEYEGDRMQEILCCVCRLPLSFSSADDGRHWEQLRRDSSFNLDFNRPFIEEMLTRTGSTKRPNPIFDVPMQIVADCMFSYQKHRGTTIGKLITTFLATCTTNFYIEGLDGESPYSLSRRCGTLQYVDMMWRNQEKERQFEARLALRAAGDDQVQNANATPEVGQVIWIEDDDEITEADEANWVEDDEITDADEANWVEDDEMIEIEEIDLLDGIW